MGKRTSIVGLIAAALLGGLLPTSSAGAAQAMCGGGTSSGLLATTFYTFTVDAKPMKKSYRIGEKMKVALTVTRPGREDPAGEGVPLSSPQRFPAADVEVSVSVYVGQYDYRYGTGYTDENGEAVVSLPAFSQSAPAGQVRAAVAARAYYNRGGCPDLEEAGYNAYNPFFKAYK